jgi:hypothetical protein
LVAYQFYISLLSVALNIHHLLLLRVFWKIHQVVHYFLYSLYSGIQTVSNLPFSLKLNVTKRAGKYPILEVIKVWIPFYLVELESITCFLNMYLKRARIMFGAEIHALSHLVFYFKISCEERKK